MTARFSMWILAWFVLATLVCGSARPAVKPPASTRTEQLEQEKLRQEIEQLRIENRDAGGVRGFFSTYAALLTGIAAVGGALTAIFNLSRQRRLDRDERAVESARGQDERFVAILANLGSETHAVQAAAAVSLFSFLRADQADYHRQVRLVTLANLKVREPSPISSLLVSVLEEALRTNAELTATETDFSGAELTGADFSGLDLRLANLRGAKLGHAQLMNVNLRGVEGKGVVLETACLRGAATDLQEAQFRGAKAAGAIFHQADLSSAKLQDADLSRARFESARLQSAHFERADLRGARFQQADINDAFFIDAKLDEAALKTLIDARNVAKAHFSPDAAQRLTEITAERERKSPPP